MGSLASELCDGRLIGYPDAFAPELVWLDHAKLKVAKEVKLGEAFEYASRPEDAATRSP